MVKISATNSNSKNSNKAKRLPDSRWVVSKEFFIDEKHVSFKDLKGAERLEHILLIVAKLLALLLVIFTFICTLGVLADAFKLIGGKGIGSAIKNNKFIQNPISASIIGMVVTLILQSGSTLISVLVGMVAGGLLTVHQAVPIMIGSEMGASFMNALISLGQSGNRDQFRRAFAAATMNDIFNFLSYIVVLPLEIAFGIVEGLGEILVEPLSHGHSSGFQTLSLITEPILRRIVQIDTEAINNLALENESSLALHETFVFRCIDLKTHEELVFCPYEHLFARSTMSDVTIGISLLVAAVLALAGCLIGIVKLMQSLLAGQVAVLVRRLMDQECPPPFTCLTNYIVMLVGCLVVIVVQSSSVFRSALTPLVGIGIVTLDRLYALILGANVGTTFTGILAALSADPSRLKQTMQIALCQTVYNILGILMFYPIPQTRIPIPLAMKLGDTTAKYRWFALVYIFVVFFAIPATLLALSFLPSFLMISIVGVVFALVCLIALFNLLQTKCPGLLPRKLRNWNFLPVYFRSLRPYDQFMRNLCSAIPFCGWRFACSDGSRTATLEDFEDSAEEYSKSSPEFRSRLSTSNSPKRNEEIFSALSKQTRV